MTVRLPINLLDKSTVVLPVEAVIFDLDNTLIDNDAAERAAAVLFLNQHCADMGYSEDEFSILWRNLSEEHVRRYLRGQCSFLQQRRARLRAIFEPHEIFLDDVTADQLFQDYLRAYETSWMAYPDVVPCLQRLHNIPLGIVSNGHYEQQIRKLYATDLRPYFSMVLTHDSVGVAKPDAEIFLDGCRRLHVDPHHALYIGDDWEADIVGSRQTGMQGIWLKRHVSPDTQDSRGAFTIKSLNDLG